MLFSSVTSSIKTAKILVIRTIKIQEIFLKSYVNFDLSLKKIRHIFVKMQHFNPHICVKAISIGSLIKIRNYSKKIYIFMKHQVHLNMI